MATKLRHNIYLSREVSAALGSYYERQRDRFRSLSEAVEHLLRRALFRAVSEEEDELLAPAVAAAVRQAQRDHLQAVLRVQTERIASLLARTDQDALAAAREAASAVGVAAEVLAVVTGDPARAQAVADEALLRAGAKYARRAERAREGA